MYVHNDIPICIFHIAKRHIPQNSSIVDEHVNTSKVVNSSLDDPVSMLDRVIIWDSNTTRLIDFLNYNIRSSGVRAFVAIDRSAQVIDDHLRASRSKELCILPA